MHVPGPLLDLVVAAVADGARVALVVRHAARGPIEDLARHHEVPLTDDGHAAAEESGRRLAGRLGAGGAAVAFAHSPVHRCGQTAAGLARGLADGRRVVVHTGPHDGLGADYLRDPAEVVRQYASGAHRFVRRWFDGEVDPAVIAPRAVVARRVLDAVDELLHVHPLVVAVTHDWNVAAVREEALAVRLEDTGWPAFLDGFVVVRAPAHPGDPRPASVVRGVPVAVAAGSPAA